MEKLSIRTTNLFFLIFLLAYVGLSFVAGILLAGVNLPFWSIFVISDLILLLPVAVFLLVFGVNPLKLECVQSTGIANLLLSVVYAYALLPLMLLLNMITMTFTENAVDDMLTGVSEYSFWVQLLLMAVMPAVLEEWIFRGVLREPYRRRNLLGAALLSGLFFGIIHMNVNQFAYAFAMGIAFAFLVEASGSIFCSMAAHFAINANSVILTVLSFGGEELEEYAEQTQTAGEIMFVYVVMLVFAVGGIGIAITVLRAIARRSGRLAHMAEIFRNGFRVQDEETTRFIDPYFLGAVAIGVTFMIFNL